MGNPQNMELSIKAVGWMEESFKSIIPVESQEVIPVDAQEAQVE